MAAKSHTPKLKECDLVMKGGITSGVVYPRAVLALKDKYRFRNIGGGSVGAVAAALTAAAELGRDAEGENTGFSGMRQAQEALELQEGFLQDLFRPPITYKPLMDAALALAPLLASEESAEESRLSQLLRLKSALIRCSPEVSRKGRLGGGVGGGGLGALLGVFVGAMLCVLFLILGRTVGSLSGWHLVLMLLGPGLILGILFGWLGGLIGGPILAAFDLFRLATKEMPEHNFYGLSIGSGEPGTETRPLLTDWLSGLLDSLANIGGEGPLTFGHLKAAPVPDKSPEEPGVALKMLTTNLNHREPYVFPREANTFLFKEDEIKHFFPGCVFQYLCDNAASTGVEPPEGFRFLPQGDKLPVIVPVRMAISFPVLLSTVPLYTVKETSMVRLQNEGGGLTKRDLQRNLFSDGGICSNFPIHFFDAWLPRRPTFGINLTSVVDEGADESPGDEETAAFSTSDVSNAPFPWGADSRTERVRGSTEPWLPRPDDPDSREWTPFKGLVKFFEAILYSAMNYRDAMQSRLPSYQERVVQVPLRPQEGGLNLDMEPEMISSLACRGQRAGEMLSERSNFKHHRWVRLRVLLAELERQLEGTGEALGSIIGEGLIDEQLADDGDFPHPFPDNREDRSEDAELFSQLLRLLIEYLQLSPDERFPPIPGEDPEPMLRITPNV
jgi:hypothetical protein